jgi:hypothetical protein
MAAFFRRTEIMFKKNKEFSNIANSLMVASSILIFHVILLAGLGILVFIFSGIVNYFFWIFLGGAALISGSAYLFYRYMKKKGSATFLRLLSLPELKGKNVEINLLGGLASFKVTDDDKRTSPEIENNADPEYLMLEDPESKRFRDISALAGMLEKDLITREEYNHLKKSLLN